MSLAHFDDIFNICDEYEKKFLFSKEYRSGIFSTEKEIIISPDIGTKEERKNG